MCVNNKKLCPFFYRLPSVRPNFRVSSSPSGCDETTKRFSNMFVPQFGQPAVNIPNDQSINFTTTPQFKACTPPDNTAKQLPSRSQSDGQLHVRPVFNEIRNSFYKQFIDTNRSDCNTFISGSMPDISDFSCYQKKIKNNKTIPSSSETNITSFTSSPMPEISTSIMPNQGIIKFARSNLSATDVTSNELTAASAAYPLPSRKSANPTPAPYSLSALFSSFCHLTNTIVTWSCRWLRFMFHWLL